ncbi:DUF192 domain-containing protein [Lysobacter sp. SG-8]|uniref:DUF192 domain-containing protein n=1 Tax=Marilutibacter penaei TaxID=2759900 RepID=A0A7W3U4A9_9GAMM|nr:DUF192 domain-containing protein [Lysobacter penaei]MBB1088716.1 DUF192 domain-containing protein [Lysobacter penaei]
MSFYRGGECLVPNGWAALSWWARLRGLLFRSPLASDGSEAMLISPCGSIHTFGMGYAIDAVFVDGAGTVLGVREHVSPWRARIQKGARSVIEFHAGAARRLSIKPGDVIEWR